MKVLFVGNYSDVRRRTGYAGVFVDRQMASIAEAGVEVDYYDIGLDTSVRALWRAWRGLRAMVKETSPDIVHAQYGAAVGLLSVFSGRPTVVTFCGTDLHRGGSRGLPIVRSFVGRLASNLAALFASRIIYVSEALRGEVWLDRPRASTVIPRGVGLDFFTPGPREEARARLGWTGEHPVALFAGGSTPVNKGLVLAEEAVQRARAAFPDLELHVLRGVPPEEMPLYYRAADLLLFTSVREGSPNAVKEALACALPVVSVRVGDVEERLAGVEPSAVVPRDPQRLADAIVAVVRDGRRSNGRELVSSISLEAVARRIVDIYQGIAGIAPPSRTANIPYEVRK